MNEYTPEELFHATLYGYAHSEDEFLRGLKAGFDIAMDENADNDSFLAGAIHAVSSSALFVKGAIHGIKLTEPGGRDMVASAWLREYKDTKSDTAPKGAT